jgi:hypothetical protein
VFGCESIGNTRYGIGYTGTGSNDGNTWYAGDPAPSFGSMSRCLFVSHVNDPNTFIYAAIIDINNVGTGKR